MDARSRITDARFERLRTIALGFIALFSFHEGKVFSR